MKKYVALFLVMITPIYSAWSGQKNKQIGMVSSIGSNTGNIYFKTTPIIAADSSRTIYALDNRLSELHIINLDTGTARTIARQGQGPGELMHPLFMALDERRIYVLDSTGISMFNKDGLFEGRFRVFHLPIDLAVDNEKIYVAQAGSPELITAYDLKGNKITSFGTKYTVDYDLYKEWSVELTDSVINSGRILFSQDAIFYVSTLFADVFIFDKDGRFINRKKILPVDLVGEIENRFFHAGLKEKEKGGYGFFTDFAYFEGSFYGLALRKIFKNSPGDIIKFGGKDLKIDETYKFPGEEALERWRILDFCVMKGEKGQPQFCLSYYDDQLAEFKVSIFRILEEE